MYLPTYLHLTQVPRQPVRAATVHQPWRHSNRLLKSQEAGSDLCIHGKAVLYLRTAPSSHRFMAVPAEYAYDEQEVKSGHQPGKAADLDRGQMTRHGRR